MSGMLSALHCRCDDRRAAESAGTFRYVRDMDAWTFPKGERRDMSPVALFRAFIDRSDYDHPDHRGELYRFHCCPWCGGDLPYVTLDPVRSPYPPLDLGEGPEE